MASLGQKRVAVIGAGASGLCSIKCCLDEGFSPVCLERTSDIGGLWNYTEDAKEGQACVMKSTVINTSKEIMCYSDFPIPEEYPNYMHNRKVMDYFRLYVRHFHLEKYIRFNTDVLKVRKSIDFLQTGRWDIDTKDTRSGEERTETFDAVLVCTGHHADKNIASFPGEEEFEGKRVHTHDYRDHRGYEDKRVVVIGIGNSGGDVAVELSKIAKQVYLSTRTGAWVLNRVGPSGKPFDMNGLRRFLHVIPLSLRNFAVEKAVNHRFNHADYGLKPNFKVFSSHPMVNDELPNRIICGTVVVKPNISSITKTGVKFTDGSYEDDIDLIIYATGYTFGFPFLEDKSFEVKQNKVNLYKFMFAPDMKHHTLAVIGYIQPWGAINPISEMQSRLACSVFKGTRKLPSRDAMWQDVRQKQADMAARYVASPRHTIQVDFIPFMDELAELNGCKPSFTKLWLTDPVLAYHMVFGPCVPFQYRLTGPGAWAEARQAILSTWDRTYHPLRSARRLDTIQNGVRAGLWWRLMMCVVLLACFLRYLTT